jgi:hypothetical protein
MVDYSDMGGRTIREVGHALTTEGLGVASGFILAGFLGRQVQSRVKSDAEVAAAPTLQNYAYAWAGNNIPKVAGWYLLRRYDAGTELTADIKKAFMGSVVFDTIMRLLNKGTNPASANIGGFEFLGERSIHASGGAPAGDVQRLIQENTALRAELNKVYQAAGIESIPDGAAEARRRKYAAMEAEALQTGRQKKYAFMQDTGLSDLTAKFGML